MSPLEVRQKRLDRREPRHDPGFSDSQRFQFLIELSNQYYWESDVDGRFTVFFHGHAEEQDRMAEYLLGKRFWETEGTPLHGNWQDHQAVVEDRQQFVELLVKGLGDNTHFFAFSGRPRFAGDDEFLGYTGTARDVTQEVHERRLARLDTELTCLFQATDAKPPLRQALQQFCELLLWNSGKYWVFDAERRDARVVARAQGCASGTQERSGERDYRRIENEYCIRLVSHSGNVMWVDNLARQNHDLEQLSDCAVFVPVGLHGKQIGAIEFRSAQMPQRDERLEIVLRRLATLFARAYEREYTIRQIRESREQYSSTVELAAIGISHVGLDGNFLHVNKYLVELLGYTEAEMMQKSVREISHPDDQNVTDTMIERMTMREIGSFTVEKRYISKDGEIVWVRINSTMKWDDEGRPLYHISTIEDISDRKKAEERVTYLATHDELTNIPSRTFFNELLVRAIRSAKRRKMQNLAVLFVDLDRFKIVNDSLGHEAGDALLREVAVRISSCIRDGDCVARHGGDEFIVLLEDLHLSEDASIVARNIIKSVHDPITLKGQECRISVSIGIAMFPEHGTEAGVLTRNADVAMYSAKQNGKNCAEVYSPDLAPMSLERLTLEQQLQYALERGEFRVLYQPKVDARTGEVKGVEALLRWWNHELGTITPAQFIPVAEDTGLIVSIGKWVLHQACEQTVAWLRDGLPRITMSVNLSPRQFSDATLLDDISEILEQTHMPPELLELEITESMLASDIDRAIEIASELRNLGIRLAIDDFGTGYSSMLQLKRFPLDTLKIDRSFVRDLPESKQDMAIVEAIIAMSKTLGVTVVAEGVESENQRDYLTGRACDQLQGFFYGKASHPDAIAKSLLSNSQTNDSGAELRANKV